MSCTVLLFILTAGIGWIHVCTESSDVGKLKTQISLVGAIHSVVLTMPTSLKRRHTSGSMHSEFLINVDLAGLRQLKPLGQRQDPRH